MSIDLNEEAAIQRVTEQLKTAFSDRRTPDEIEAAVAEARESLSTLPIRTHVPVLIERKARRILKEHSGQGE
ncbi:hypothetical protein OG568_08605 [Streptomyces sp. NBC_01450]|uniref:three-helix bundle dimerization domain-containing protein n=1 Tax=Streptomyces sp. NBC_01450 TaxID=2903871 RepID=UPI002E37601D|nr:hypothetical protein [Streptomyces sp. NBC_01450]